ncbi:MAG TPA: 2-phospho-L-lactate guanylyltransferase [Solirubrobacteraceae bacterium]|nr:2-phospho-L-lactate guanylyltransferase [Solirubrobacteraceae bacterium]
MTVAVLPIKTFPRAKSRTGLDAPDRAALAESMARDVLAALARVPSLEAILVVTREPRAAAAARAAGAGIVDDPEEAGHSEAALIGVREALRRGAARVLLVPGDCPLIDAGEVDALLRDAGRGVTIVPDRHGTGTNALVLDPPDAMAPSFGPGSCERHERLARAAGLAVRVAHVPSLAFDVDTPADVAALRVAA